MTPRSFEEPATAGSLGQFNEGLGPHHLVGECLKKTDHRYGAIAVRQRDLASGETMGKRVRGIVGVIVIVGVMMIVIVMMITRVRDQLTRGRRRGLTTPLSHDHEIRREQSGIHPHRMRIDRRDLLRDGPNLPPREPLHVRENPVRRGLKLADFERAVLTALPPVTRVDDPDLPTGKKGHLRFEQGESLEQRQWIGGAVQLDEKGVASALLSGEAEFDQPFETVTTGTARRDRSNRGSARRQGRRSSSAFSKSLRMTSADRPPFRSSSRSARKSVVFPAPRNPVIKRRGLDMGQVEDNGRSLKTSTIAIFVQ